jgi:hypothetical protein
MNKLNKHLQQYDYERYLAVNPNLTREMYQFLRGNKTEWKILCGFEVKMNWSDEVLEPIVRLQIDNQNIYDNRYNTEYYLALNTW